MFSHSRKNPYYETSQSRLRGKFTKNPRPAPRDFINRDPDKLFQLAKDIVRWVGEEVAKTKEIIIKQLQRINSTSYQTA